jgi:hypothetical protein
MPSVVIIHAPDDALPARALGEKLRAAQLTPVTERAAGEERQNAIKNAAVTIALWSPRSVADTGVAGDVAFARARGKLIHACMQSVQPPPEMRGEQWVDLTGWRGEDEFAGWRQLATLATDKAGVAPLPPPAPRPASGFFQPGRVETGAPPTQPPQPQPRAPRPAPQPVRAAAPPPPRAPAPAAPQKEKSGGPNMALIGVITFLVVAIGGGGGYYFWNQSQSGGATAAWAEVDRGDPDQVRAFLAGQPGALRGEAEEALELLEQSRYAAARSTDTIQALEAFVADFPDSESTLAARGRIAELRAQPAAPAEAEAGEALTPEALNPTVPLDPDLVPPGSTGGPAPLQPEPEPAPETPPATEEPAPTPG